MFLWFCSGNQTLCLVNIFMIFAASHNKCPIDRLVEVCSWHVADKSRQDACSLRQWASLKG